MKLRRIVSNSFHGLFFSHCLPAVITSGWVSLALVGSTQAQPTIVSTVPGLLTTGVSPSAAVVFTFSTEMDTNATSAQFADFSSFPPTFYPTEPSWNTAGTILTCTPNPAFPSNKQITWVKTNAGRSTKPLSTRTCRRAPEANSAADQWSRCKEIPSPTWRR